MSTWLMKTRTLRPVIRSTTPMNSSRTASWNFFRVSLTCSPEPAPIRVRSAVTVPSSSSTQAA